MGRSTPSCFNIIACGSDSGDNDHIGASEANGASIKRGWSFRKRSARHRVLSNNANSETLSSGNKESPDSGTDNIQSQTSSSAPEKTSAVQWTGDQHQLSTSVDLKPSEIIVSSKDNSKAESNLDESVVIVIQSAIRGSLAQIALLKLKKVVKIQAAVRGHLVRRHAVGTLRCVQAIARMQALVRARRARLLLNSSCTEEKEKENFVTKPNLTSTSIKLLSNGFARQLLESTPRTKAIHIKCDPPSSDSAWKWLERWMSVSSTGIEQLQKQESNKEQQEHEKVEHSVSESGSGVPSESYCKSVNVKSDTRDIAVPLEGEEILIANGSKSNIGDAAVPLKSRESLMTYDPNNLEAGRPPSLTSPTDNLGKPWHENSGTVNSKESSTDLSSIESEQSDSTSQTEVNSFASKPEMESEQSKCSTERISTQQLETEGKTSASGTRKATNPTFVAAQSKFEELSSATNSARSTISSNKVGRAELNTDVSSAVNEATRKEIELEENSSLHDSMIQVGGSECSPELSISSTLDSPDRSEVEASGVEHEIRVADEGTSDRLNAEAKGDESTPLPDSYPIKVQPEKLDIVNFADGEALKSVTVPDSFETEQNSKKNTADVQIEVDSGMGHQACKVSPGASPRSHITVPESQGTPSSQVSVKAKRTKGDKSGSNPKHGSSSGKRSHSNPNHDSGGRDSLEQLPKDQKTGKRRNSFGSSKSDHDHQETIDSSSSSSLPSYMQATESARAKALANSSPRSSPDVQEKDSYIKKRHSLTGVNGKQGSPRTRQSVSKEQQGAKGNGSHANEREWRR